jgi:hypothetical protein
MKLDFSVLRDCMTFHSREYKLIGNAIAWAEANGKPTANMPNHSGFIVSWQGQWMAAEVDGDEFALNSLEKYNCDKEWIISIYDPIISDAERAKLLDAIAKKVRKSHDTPYDLAGAISSAPFAKRVLWFVAPWLKPSPTKEFCSEVVYQLTGDNTHLTFPPEWKTNPPNPLVLAQWQETHPSEWRKVA